MGWDWSTCSIACSPIIHGRLPSSPLTCAAVGEQLAEKAAAHDMLLQCLSEGGVLQRLPPSTLRSLLEDGRKLRALQAIRSGNSSSGAGPGRTHGSQCLRRSWWQSAMCAMLRGDDC